MAKAKPKTPEITETDSSANLHSAEVIPLPVNAPPVPLMAGDFFASPLNPRRRPAGPEADQELEDSIVEKGLLEPILARPAAAGAPARFEIVCGNRRHAAVSAAIAKGRLPADWTLFASVKPVSDEDLIVLAGIENLQRADMHPLDEAALFESLRGFIKARNPKADVGTEIAHRFRVSRRKVYSRLRLLKLAPKVRTALGDGKIQLQHAEILALGEPEDQARWLPDLVDGGDYPPDLDELRWHMLHKRPPFSAAAFDPDLYAGEILEHDGEHYFADLKEFKTLQETALEAKLAELAKKWPWARTLKKGEHFQQFRQVGKKDEDAGAIAWIDDEFKLQIRESVIDPETARKREKAAAKDKENAKPVGRAIADESEDGGDDLVTPRAPVRQSGKKAEKRCLTDGQAIRAKAAKSHAMRLGIVDRPKVALALACLALLDNDSEVDLRLSHDYSIRSRENEPIRAAGPEGAILKERCAKAGVEPRRRNDYYSNSSSAKQADSFRKLLARDDRELALLFAALLATRVGSWFNGEHRIGDSPLAIAIAEAADADKHLPATWKPDEDHFKAHGRDALERLGMVAGRNAGLTKTDAFGAMKKGELVKRLIDAPAGTWTPDKFVETRFLTDADMKKAFAAAGKSAAPRPERARKASVSKDKKPKKPAKAKPVKKPAKKKAA